MLGTETRENIRVSLMREICSNIELYVHSSTLAISLRPHITPFTDCLDHPGAPFRSTIITRSTKASQA